ncbi:MAG TPA: hypothetical protein VFS15_01745 [Kofleriaceae bacterium]|nr:hypothetical protein [Kofleriaceae bacterium]
MDIALTSRADARDRVPVGLSQRHTTRDPFDDVAHHDVVADDVPDLLSRQERADELDLFLDALDGVFQVPDREAERERCDGELQGEGLLRCGGDGLPLQLPGDLTAAPANERMEEAGVRWYRTELPEELDTMR